MKKINHFRHTKVKIINYRVKPKSCLSNIKFFIFYIMEFLKSKNKNNDKKYYFYKN